MKPSSDIDLFTTTLPFPVLVFRTVLLPRTFAGCTFRAARMTLHAPGSHRLASDKRPPQAMATIARRGMTRLEALAGFWPDKGAQCRQLLCIAGQHRTSSSGVCANKAFASADIPAPNT
jgi:hypothetical protein